MEKIKVKYTVNLETLPEDTKGYTITESGNTKKPWKVEGVTVVDMEGYLETQDLTELATRSAVIDIQKAERSKVLVELGLTTTRESGATVRAGQLERLQALKGSIPNDQYENMERLIMGR